jgi:hypothetical protein
MVSISYHASGHQYRGLHDTPVAWRLEAGTMDDINLMSASVKSEAEAFLPFKKAVVFSSTLRNLLKPSR